MGQELCRGSQSRAPALAACRTRRDALLPPSSCSCSSKSHRLELSRALVLAKGGYCRAWLRA